GRLLAAVGADRTLRVGDLKTRRIVRQWAMGENHSSAVAFSPDGRVVAWADASFQIHLRDLSADRDTRLVKGDAGGILCLAFPPDGKSLLSTGHTDSVLSWSLSTGKRLRRYGIINRLNAAAGAAFGHDGRSVLAAGNDRFLYRYEMDSIEEQLKI